MKPSKTIFLLLTLFLFSSPFLVFGDSPGESEPQSTIVSLPNPLGSAGIDSIPALIQRVIYFFQIVARGVAPLAIVVGGFYFLTSGGEPNKISIARSIILWALVGLLIVEGAGILIAIIRQSLMI